MPAPATVADAERALREWLARFEHLAAEARLVRDVRRLLEEVAPSSEDENQGVMTIEITPASTEDRYLQAKEVAEFLRTDVATLSNLRAKGEGIPWSKPTGKVLYKMADVLAAVDKGARGFSMARLNRALDSYGPLRKLTTAERERLTLHIIQELKKPGG